MVCKYMHIYKNSTCVVSGLSFRLSNLYAGLGIPQLLEAVLKLLPLDTYVPHPVVHQSICLRLSVTFVPGCLFISRQVYAFTYPQAAVMDLVDSDKQRCLAVPVWETYTVLLSQAGSQVRPPVHPVIQ